MDKSKETPNVHADVNDPESIEARLNRETARITWKELAPFFARGVMIDVDPEMDLVLVAAAIARDRQDEVKAWMDAGKVNKTDTDRAKEWEASQPELWAVVVAPWVLVQEVRE